MSPASYPLALMLLSCAMQVGALERPSSCPSVSVLQGLPDRVVHAGTAFLLLLPPKAFQGPVRHYQVSLADDMSSLPTWLVYSAQTSTLQGLALREESGEYTLRVTAVGQCHADTSSASSYFHLRVLRETSTGAEATPPRLHTELSRSNVGCPVGEAATMADLVLHVNVVSLGGVERLRLVTTMADYLHISHTSITLLSFRDTLSIRQENTTILASGHTSSLARGANGEGVDRGWLKAEVLWTVGCGDFQMLADLVQVLQHSADSGHLSVLLGVPVKGWRVLRHGTANRARKPRQLCPTPTPTLMIAPPNQVPESALRPPLAGLVTTTWQVPTLTQAQGTVAKSKLKPTRIDLQYTVEGHEAEFSLAFEETLRRTVDPPFVVSPVLLPDIMGPNREFSTTSHHKISSLHTTKYLPKDPKTPATASSDVFRRTWSVNALLDSSQSVTVFSLTSQLIAESSKRIASITLFPILPTHTMVYSSSIMHLQTPTRYYTTQLYPEESMHTSRNLPQGLFPTRTFDSLVVPRTEDSYTKGPNNILMSKGDMEPHTPTSPEQTTTTTNFIKPPETSMQKSELLSKSRLTLLPTSTMTADQKLSWSTHNILRKGTSVPWVFNGLTTKVFSTHVKTLLSLDVESNTSLLTSTASLRSLITLSLLTRQEHPQQSTPAVSAEKTMDLYSIFPTLLMHSPSDSSITLLSSLPAGSPFMHSLSDKTTSMTRSLALISGKDPSGRLSLNVQQTVLESLKHTPSSRSSQFLTPSSQSELTGFMTGTPQIGQQTSVMSHSPLETFRRSSSWFDLQVSMTSSPQSRLKTFITMPPQVQLQSPMTSQSELGNFKMTTTSGLGSTFASYSISVTVFLQFEHDTPSSLWAATPNLVTGSTRQAATTPAWSDNITETTLLFTLHHRLVASSLMKGNMITESTAATISEQSSKKTPLIDYFSSITLSQALSKRDPKSLSPAYTFFIAPTIPRTGWIDSLLPLSSVKISMQATSLRDMTGASSLNPPQFTTVHPLSATRPQSSREWLISDSVIFQTEPAALPSRADVSDIETHSSEAPLKINSSTEGTLNRLTPQMFHSTTPPSPQHDTPDLRPTGSTGDTQPPWLSYSGKTLATVGLSKRSSLGKAQQTLEPSLTEMSSLTTSIFTPYPLFTRSHFSLSATPQNLLPTAKIHTEDLIPSTAEWSYSLASHSQSLDPSYPFSISAITRDILEIEESGLTSPLAWFSLVETLGDYIWSCPSESIILLSDLSCVMAVQPYSEGSLTEAMTMGEPVTPFSTLLSAVHVPSLSSEPSLLQSPHDLLTSDLAPTTTTEANAETTLSTLLSSLPTSLRMKHRLSPESSASHDERSTDGFPSAPVQQSSVGNDSIAPPADILSSSTVYNRLESGSVVPLPPLPVLPVTQAMTRLNIPITVHQHDTQYTSLSSQFSSMTLWPPETPPLWHFSSTSMPARTRGINIFLDSSMKQSITQQALSSTTSIGPSNLPPIVLQSIPALEATVGFPFHFFIPSRTFSDPEDGKANQLTLEISPLDGSPSGPASWVGLDQKLQLLHGVPLESDLQFSPQQLLLLARDSAGLTAQLPLVIELRRAPQEPCHTYVLTTRNSLHSFLRERRRIEWFLAKLARFFNDTSASNLALLSLGAGSTIVAWYNFTLCQHGGRAEGWCPEHQIRSLWVGMKTEDRRVDPAFSQAMLPEFPITEVGELKFGGACLLRTPTAAHPTPATTALTPQSDLYPWTARLLIALLIICGLFLLAVLLMVILRSCRRRGTLSLRPSEVYPTHPLEQRALKPRLPPLFQEEVPPPPLQLWLNLTPLPQREPFTMAPTHTNHQHTRAQRRTVPDQPPPRYQLPPPYSPSSYNHEDKPHKTPDSKYRL